MRTLEPPLVQAALSAVPAMQLIVQNLPPEVVELDLRNGGLAGNHMPALASALSDPASKLATLKCVPLPLLPLPHARTAVMLAFVWLAVSSR